MYSDNRLAHMLKNYLFNNADKPHLDPLKSQKLCGSRVIHAPGWQPAVYIISNDEKARTFGIATCHSPWACPKCSPVVMAKWGERIACAIEALKKQGELATMFTFTIPHTKGMTCKETFDTLKDAWRMFSRDGNRATNKDTYTKRNGTISTYHKAQGPYGQMRFALHSKHNVRVYEFTWGEHSWHPHIHALFWFPKQFFYHCVEWETKLLDRWWHCAKHCYLKILNKKHPESKQQNIKMANELYADWRKYPKTGHRSFWISKEADGSPRVMDSSYYLSGWTGDFEITHENSKEARAKGHFSPFQILENAYQSKLNENKTTYEKWMKLFTEYALATKKAIRCQFSQSGLNKIIAEWKQTKDYFNAVKKKFMDKATDKKPYKVVAWLTELQWYTLSDHEKNSPFSITADILDIASKNIPLHKRREIITKILMSYDIDITNNHVNTKQALFVENQIFENKLTNKPA